MTNTAKLYAFLHSHSYAGNPLGCAAALASLAIFRDDRVLERNRDDGRTGSKKPCALRSKTIRGSPKCVVAA
jgi:adenosylmethionine-8-amino-7-oxononanoate aminotransferase